MTGLASSCLLEGMPVFESAGGFKGTLLCPLKKAPAFEKHPVFLSSLAFPSSCQIAFSPCPGKPFEMRVGPHEAVSCLPRWFARTSASALILPLQFNSGVAFNVFK